MNCNRSKAADAQLLTPPPPVPHPTLYPLQPQQAAEQAEKTKEEQRREGWQNLTEISHTLASDMMTEEVAAASGPVGGARPRMSVDRWKGMSDEQRSAICREREEQCAEKRVCVCFVFAVETMQHKRLCYCCC